MLTWTAPNPLMLRCLLCLASLVDQPGIKNKKTFFIHKSLSPQSGGTKNIRVQLIAVWLSVCLTNLEISFSLDCLRRARKYFEFRIFPMSISPVVPKRGPGDLFAPSKAWLRKIESNKNLEKHGNSQRKTDMA